MASPTPLTLAQAALALREGKLTAERLLGACLSTISAREPQVGAWASLAAPEALAMARAIDAGQMSGNTGDAGADGDAGDPASTGVGRPAHAGIRGAPGARPSGRSRSVLRGIPIGVKDIIDVKGLVTGCNSPVYAGRIAERDATIVARARAAGAIVLGKTTTQEFATRGNMPATRNPHSALHTPGGSSSGSAASVAAGMVPVALSTQTAGSIVRPASYCGIVGFKPSFGWMPLDGVKTIAPSLDTLGLHARNVADAALAYAALIGSHPVANHEVPDIDALVGRPLCAGIVRDPYWALAEPATVQALDFATRRLRAAGLQVVELTLPAGFEGLGTALDTISDAEACLSLAPEWAEHRALLSPGVQNKLARGLATPASRTDAAYALAHHCRAESGQLFGACDFVLTPSSPGYAPLLTAGDPGDSAFSKLWTILGTPSISVPVPLPGPLPIGLEVICDAGQDLRALQVARAIEAIFSQRSTRQ